MAHLQALGGRAFPSFLYALQHTSLFLSATVKAVKPSCRPALGKRAPTLGVCHDKNILLLIAAAVIVQ
jgi:hypothetical protein